MLGDFALQREIIEMCVKSALDTGHAHNATLREFRPYLLFLTQLQNNPNVTRSFTRLHLIANRDTSEILNTITNRTRGHND